MTKLNDVTQSRNSLPISTPTEIVKVRWVDVILNRKPENYSKWKSQRYNLR